MSRRILLMHITSSSGHYRASCALAQAIRRLEPNAHVVAVDAFQYTSPLVRWAIARSYRSYLSLIRHQPDVWGYLYDNPDVHRRLQGFQALLHRYQAGKLQRLLDDVRPEVIACTQAYPCGVVADFKRRNGLPIPLVGVLTDYAPHLYWFHDAVDVYVVPSETVKQRFLTRGVEEARLRVLGIPIDPAFGDPTDRLDDARQFGLDASQPMVLVMGGGSGLGQLREIVANLDTLPLPCQFVVATGSNTALLTWLRRRSFRHRVIPLGYTTDIPKLMDLATLLISKPGGLTTAESLAKRLPLIMVNPIPGQEAYNARFLLARGAAVQAESPEAVREAVQDLLTHPERMEALRQREAELARPAAALDIARLLFDLAKPPPRAHPQAAQELFHPASRGG